ncbi:MULTISPECIES: protein kinase domain-containing protein [unclassified Curtobacterium]|jgi:serine/threonine-protein kinase|uniref:serine/threonine protein kinase n=1 Tax=unclassified Curtobacterium TaxID=257496 RepID=UPI000F4933EF|nr:MULTISPECIES: protein kinase [unclassified Curtobacterium]ROQ04927.1 serine/threonine-protein kinase [Curtobacterium sp. PhB171]ROQ22127.1 serine/threonine-protein kinase [Curtobacterium sp. PhB170]ROS33487.1 serine/threonine-protein kinase [Curtobacterium sp. PhB131]ROS64807.1 serine/threonine-protein kinase [Curtobacterium sp. PhB141]
MNITDLLDAVTTALGLEDPAILTRGGQKVVLTATLAGSPAIAKIVPVPDGPQGLIVIERSHREVELLAAVDSPAVVKVLSDAVEIGEPTSAVCWVEERLDGDDLSDHLGAPWEEGAVWDLARDLAAALAACHTLDVVHRDLSAKNVRALPDGRFVLMDPGLARHLTKATITGYYQPGTAGWRSPEHVPGGEPVPASDVFSLGIILYYALTSTFPIDPTVDDVAYDRALVTTQARPVGEIRTDVSLELSALVDRCLQRQPARRFLDGTELLAHLENLAATEGRRS